MTSGGGSNLVDVTQCPACAGSSFSTYLEDGGHKIVTCADCGLMLVTPRARVEDVKRFFADEYINEQSTIYDTFASPRAASLKREADRIRAHSMGGRLLDIGTASGAFLGEFAGDRGWRVEGIEPSGYAARKASERYGVPVHAGFLDDQDFEAQTFDVVTSLDAFIMHAEPDKDARLINRILKPGGLFALDIPGVNFRLLKGTGIGSRLFYGGKVRLHVGVNLFYYTRATLTLLLERQGFEFVASWPEQAPYYGSSGAKLANSAYFAATSLLYRATSGGVHYAPKEFIIYRKVS